MLRSSGVQPAEAHQVPERRAAVGHHDDVVAGGLLGGQRRPDLRVERRVVVDRLGVGDLDAGLLGEVLQGQVLALEHVDVIRPVGEVHRVVQLLLGPPGGRADAAGRGGTAGGRRGALDPAGGQERADAQRTRAGARSTAAGTVPAGPRDGPAGRGGAGSGHATGTGRGRRPRSGPGHCHAADPSEPPVQRRALSRPSGVHCRARAVSQSGKSAVDPRSARRRRPARPGSRPRQSSAGRRRRPPRSWCAPRNWWRCPGRPPR